MPVGKPPLSLVMRVAGKTALLGAPLMVLMFMLFPRIGPLWGVHSLETLTTMLSSLQRLECSRESASQSWQRVQQRGVSFWQQR